MSNNGYIKLHRSMLDWEWYSDVNTFRLFVHMLFKANWKDGRFKGCKVPRGSFVSSSQALANETSLSRQQVRTALKHLKLTNEITIRATSSFTVYTIVNYRKYQDDDRQPNQPLNQRLNQQVTNEQPTINQQVTTIEEYKNIRKKEKEEPLPIPGDSGGFFSEKNWSIIWDAYPRQINEPEAKRAYKKILAKYSNEKIYAAIKRYAHECERADVAVRYIKYPKKFFESTIEEYV